MCIYTISYILFQCSNYPINLILQQLHIYIFYLFCQIVNAISQSQPLYFYLKNISKNQSQLITTIHNYSHYNITINYSLNSNTFLYIIIFFKSYQIIPNSQMFQSNHLYIFNHPSLQNQTHFFNYNYQYSLFPINSEPYFTSSQFSQINDQISSLYAQNSQFNQNFEQFFLANSDLNKNLESQIKQPQLEILVQNILQVDNYLIKCQNEQKNWESSIKKQMDNKKQEYLQLMNKQRQSKREQNIIKMQDREVLYENVKKMKKIKKQKKKQKNIKMLYEQEMYDKNSELNSLLSTGECSIIKGEIVLQQGLVMRCENRSVNQIILILQQQYEQSEQSRTVKKCSNLNNISYYWTSYLKQAFIDYKQNNINGENYSKIQQILNRAGSIKNIRQVLEYKQFSRYVYIQKVKTRKIIKQIIGNNKLNILSKLNMMQTYKYLISALHKPSKLRGWTKINKHI